MQFGPASLGNLIRETYGHCPRREPPAVPMGSIVVLRTAAPRMPAFLPGYRARVLERPLASGVRMVSEIIQMDGVPALVGAVTEQLGLTVTSASSASASSSTSRAR